jgi:hypothetical protein
MRPETRHRAKDTEHRAEFIELGIPEEWVPVLIDLGYETVEKLAEVEGWIG